MSDALANISPLYDLATGGKGIALKAATTILTSGVGAGAGAAAGAGAGLFGTGISGGTLLSGLLTGASAFGQMQAGNMQADIMNIQARQMELNARMESIKGRQQALQIRKQLDRDLASQNATFAARGVLSGEGSSLAAADISRKNAEEDINIAMFGAKMGSESDRLQAAQYRAEGGAAKTAGRIEAINTISTYRPVASLLEGI